MFSGYQIKAICRDRMNISRFSELHGIGQGRTFFFTLTFKDNIRNKRIAGDLWSNLHRSIRKQIKIFCYVAVWERQKRGAWHMHALCHSPLVSMRKFCSIVKDFTKVSSKPYGFINAKWTSGRDYKGMAYYLTKYLTKEKREARTRYVAYSNNWVRSCRLPFSWVGGKSARWRERCSAIRDQIGTIFNMIYKIIPYDNLLYCIARDTLEDSIEYLRTLFKFSNSVSRAFWNCKVAGFLTKKETYL